MNIRAVAAEIDRVVVGLHYTAVGRHHTELGPRVDAIGVEAGEEFYDLTEFLAAGLCTEAVARRRFPYDGNDAAASMLAKLQRELHLDEQLQPNPVLSELLQAILQAQADTAADVWPSELGNLQRDAESAFSKAKGPLVDAFRQLPVPETPAHQLLHTLTGVRYGRHDAHIEAWQSFGLSGPAVAALGAAVSGETLAQTPGTLREAGWVDETGNATDEGRGVRSVIEARTDEGCEAMYRAVADLEDWHDALQALPGQV